jgi:hypothetical protein
MKRAVCALTALVAATAFAQPKRAFTIEDVYRVKTISDLALSPDERTIANTVATPDLPRATRSTRIWMMNADGTNAHALPREIRRTARVSRRTARRSRSSARKTATRTSFCFR